MTKKEILMNGDAQRMTSLEIAEVTGKQHKNVMQAIRNMEPAWEKASPPNPSPKGEGRRMSAK